MEGEYGLEKYFNDLKNYKVFFIYDGRDHKSGVIIGYDSLEHKIKDMAQTGLFSPAAVIEAYMWGKNRGDLVNGKVFLVAYKFPELVQFSTAGVYHLVPCEKCTADTCDVCPTFECVGCSLGG